MDKVIVIGFGGVSRAGKSSLVRKIKELLSINESLHIDNYLKSPIQKYDENLKDNINDYEDPIAYDLDKFHKDLINIISNTKNKFILVEGFLLFSRKDISDLIDIKIILDVDKEIARERRKNTKDYPSDYYFDEYIWKGWNENK